MIQDKLLTDRLTITRKQKVTLYNNSFNRHESTDYFQSVLLNYFASSMISSLNITVLDHYSIDTENNCFIFFSKWLLATSFYIVHGFHCTGYYYVLFYTNTL